MMTGEADTLFVLAHLLLFACIARAEQCEGEVLYNGICLPKQWPPVMKFEYEWVPPTPPYLESPPDPINIDVGRQLFVDDFLINTDASSADLDRIYHNATYLPPGPLAAGNNPVIRPDRSWEGENVTTAFATAYSGGAWYYPPNDEYMLWYRCGPGSPAAMCLAVSNDTLTWRKPAFDVVKGTNTVINVIYDGSTVWLDMEEPDPSRRFKAALIEEQERYHGYTLYSSPDGIHWTKVVPVSGIIDDRSTVFFNPFRQKWIYSIKHSDFSTPPDSRMGRCRYYVEGDDLFADANKWPSDNHYADGKTVFNWTGADKFDPSVGCGAGSGSEGFTQLYNLDGVAYESLMVGFFSIFTGKMCKTFPVNRSGEWDSVFLGFSRDGFHWFRPILDGQHRVFLPMDDTLAPPWIWNKANVQSVGGGFLVVDDAGDGFEALRFYVGGRSGTHQIFGNASTGLATLRRDGFASIGLKPSIATGDLITRPVVFSGNFLFVNVDTSGKDASLVAELLDPGNGMAPIAPYTAGSAVRISGVNSTRTLVRWSAAGGKGNISSLASLTGRPVVMKFVLSGEARLFSFWVSPSKCGESMGYVAAGGRGFDGPRDTAGACPN